MFQQASFAFYNLLFALQSFALVIFLIPEGRKTSTYCKFLEYLPSSYHPFSCFLCFLHHACLDNIVESPCHLASRKLPGPHEVVFYSETEDSPGVMLWRYPEPRVLTFVRITPVPFNTTEDPEISTADLSDVLQVETDMNVFYSHYSKNTSLSNGCLNEFEKQAM